MTLRCAMLCCVLALPVGAVELTLPRLAQQTAERNTAPDRYAAPAGVFRDGQVVTLEIEGAVRRAAWRILQPGLTPLQLVRPLRAQLVDAGFEILLDCTAKACGGFDFRFATETLPDPNMSVNIRAYHFVTAVRPSSDAPEEVVTLLTSSTSTAAYVQVIEAGPMEDVDPLPETAPAVQPDQTPGARESDLASRLLRQGHAVLRDLDFDTGSSDLRVGSYASLDALAVLLKERAGLRVALVGHTDSVGGLEPNIVLSRQRARSVRQRLIDSHAIAGDRLEAEGMGYLAPVASNLEESGRDANRRVEVIVLSE